MIRCYERNLVTLSMAAWLALQPSAQAADDYFDVTALATSGRVVSAHAADFNGDGRTDLMLATLAGVPPTESRDIHVFFQRDDGRFPAAPDTRLPIPEFSAVYDVADLTPSPGNELVLLRPDRVSIVSLGEPGADHLHLPVPGPSTVAASDDERGFDRLKMVYDDFGDDPWILVPQIGAVTALSPSGNVLARIDPGRRANFFIAKPTAIVSVESDVQLFLDAPKLGVGDINGDGRADLVTSTRHEIRVFLRNADGGFAEDASYTHALNLISELDHSRGSGTVVPQIRDFEGDGRLDLLITHVAGSFTKSTTTTYVYRNRDGRWDIDNPDDQFVDEGVWNSDLLLNLDRDDSLELIRIQFRFSVLEMVELLLTRNVDLQIAIHRLQPDGHFEHKAWSRQKVSIGLSFDTFRPKGFMPTGGIDLNADGFSDFVTSANGKGIRVYLGGDEGPFEGRPRTQKFDSKGVVRFADFDDDGLTDFVIYDPQEFDAPIRLLRNLGRLPGSPPVAPDSERP